MATLQKFLKYWLPTILWAGLIFFLSSRRPISTSPNYWHDFIVKKLAHLTEYFIFTLLLYRSLKNTTKLFKTKLLLFTIILTILYAISDEYHQSFTPGRQPTLRDVLIDTSGGAFALFVIDKKKSRT